jgi:hypothetical protein
MKITPCSATAPTTHSRPRILDRHYQASRSALPPGADQEQKQPGVFLYITQNFHLKLGGLTHYNGENVPKKSTFTWCHVTPASITWICPYLPACHAFLGFRFWYCKYSWILFELSNINQRLMTTLSEKLANCTCGGLFGFVSFFWKLKGHRVDASFSCDHRSHE